MTARRRRLALVSGLGAVALAVAVPWALAARRAWRAATESLEMPIEPPEAPTDLPGLREVSWSSSVGTQRGWYVPGERGTVVVAHGQPGDRSSQIPEARLLRGSGWGFLLADLPGYGGSDGARTWDETYVEAFLDAVATARAECGCDEVVAFGYSMGGWVAAEAAARDPGIRALILRSAFTQLAPQLRYEYRTAWPGASWLAVFATERMGVPVDQLDTVAALHRMTPRPTLVIGGGRDQAIPREMLGQLADAAHGERYWVEDAGHVDLPDVAGEAYGERLRVFLGRASRAP